jgi:hypothetical protein
VEIGRSRVKEERRRLACLEKLISLAFKQSIFKILYILYSANLEVHEHFSCYQPDVILSCTRYYTYSQRKIFLLFGLMDKR